MYRPFALQTFVTWTLLKCSQDFSCYRVCVVGQGRNGVFGFVNRALELSVVRVYGISLSTVFLSYEYIK